MAEPMVPPFWDDPETDGTDCAHPAWWRGNYRGVEAVVEMLTKHLDGAPVLGTCNHPGLQAVRVRVAALVAAHRTTLGTNEAHRSDDVSVSAVRCSPEP